MKIKINENSEIKPVFNMSSFMMLDAIRNEAGNTVSEYDKVKRGLLKILQANQWMQIAKSKPTPKMLFSEFWHEGEVCILFADINSGKTIFAVQIADSISKGEAIKGFKLEASAQPILYFDFELSEKQFESRYTDENNKAYEFDSNFLRAELNIEAELPDPFIPLEERLIGEIEAAVIQSGARVLIIDNITYLGNENEKARDALPLMKQLKALKKKHDLSILVLAHTPKRDSSRPLTINDVQGSKMLVNFCDSSFAIGTSHLDNRLRYVKQIKQRNTEQIYGENNVCIYKILKKASFLQFEFLNYGTECEHLRPPSEDDKQTKVEEAKRLQKMGKTQREIADALNVAVGTVNNYLRN